MIEPETESDPAGILIHVSTCPGRGWRAREVLLNIVINAHGYGYASLFMLLARMRWPERNRLGRGYKEDVQTDDWMS